MDTKTILITGANAGIGKATATVLAGQGHRLVLVNRDSGKSRQALEEIKKESGSDSVSMIYADLSEKAQVLRAAEVAAGTMEKLDVLINNAGVYRKKYGESEDGMELTTAVNLRAPVLLTQALLPLLKDSAPARIVNVSSEFFKKGKPERIFADNRKKYNATRSYSDSKLGLVLYTLMLAEDLAGTGVTANCLHPGVVATDVFRDYPAWMMQLLSPLLTSPEKSAAGPVRLALAPEFDTLSGAYCNKLKRKRIPGTLMTPEIMETFRKNLEQKI